MVQRYKWSIFDPTQLEPIYINLFSNRCSYNLHLMMTSPVGQIRRLGPIRDMASLRSIPSQVLRANILNILYHPVIIPWRSWSVERINIIIFHSYSARSYDMSSPHEKTGWSSATKMVAVPGSLPNDSLKGNWKKISGWHCGKATFFPPHQPSTGHRGSFEIIPTGVWHWMSHMTSRLGTEGSRIPKKAHPPRVNELSMNHFLHLFALLPSGNLT